MFFGIRINNLIDYEAVKTLSIGEIEFDHKPMKIRILERGDVVWIGVEIESGEYTEKEIYLICSKIQARLRKLHLAGIAYQGDHGRGFEFVIGGKI